MVYCGDPAGGPGARMQVLVSVLALLVGVGSAAVAAAASPLTPQPVEIPTGEGVTHGVLYRPEGPGPFPAVVGLHGCGGLSGRAGPVAARYGDWAQVLVNAGYVVLYPDSYASRGLGSQCTVRNRRIRTERERVEDANAARRWLQSQSYVRGDRVSLLGWSNGGISVLWAVRRRGAPARPASDAPDFRAAVAFYPGCGRLENAAWSARIPTLILIGNLDDWVSAKSCEQMVAAARGSGARASIEVFAGAYHDFDHPNRPLQVRTGNAFSTDGSGRVHTGTNPTARADVLKRVPQWLAR
jgi:dienelactone hydrolase